MTAYITGTASGHLDLMDILETFLSTNSTLVSAGEEWTVLKAETIASYTMTSPTIDPPDTSFGSTFQDLYLQGQGLAGADEIYINLRAYGLPSTGAYNWMVQGATGYNSAGLWHQQPGAGMYSNAFRYFTLTNGSIDYWITANGRRFIVICNISGDIFVSYCGLYLPFATSGEFPYPIAISGNSDDIDDLRTDSTISNFWWSNVGYPMLLRDLNGDWLRSTNNTYLSNTTPYLHIWPWFFYRTTYAQSMMGNLDGSFALMPALVMTYFGGGNVFGELDGVYFIPNTSPVNNPSSGDTITVGSDTYLVCQNISTVSGQVYAAIKLN